MYKPCFYATKLINPINIIDLLSHIKKQICMQSSHFARKNILFVDLNFSKYHSDPCFMPQSKSYTLLPSYISVYMHPGNIDELYHLNP